MNAPIRSRTMLLMQLRDGTLRHLDWNLVTTTLGRMLEPRTLIKATGAMKNEDPYDSGFTDVLVLTEADAVQVGVRGGLGGGDCWPRVFNSL
jgi:hypothetical protein